MDEVKLALEMNKLVHDKCKDVPHDIGLLLLEIVKKNMNEQLCQPSVMQHQTAYVAMNENDFDVENMSFYKSLKRAEKDYGESQKYMKVRISFENVV